MSCQDALPAAVSAAAAAMAQGKSDEEVALLAAIFTQLGDSLAMVVALMVPADKMFFLQGVEGIGNPGGGTVEDMIIG